MFFKTFFFKYKKVIEFFYTKSTYFQKKIKYYFSYDYDFNCNTNCKCLYIHVRIFILKTK